MKIINALHKSQVLFFALISFIVGILFGSLLKFDSFILFCILLALALGLIFLWKKRTLRIVLISSIFLIFGFLRVPLNDPNCLNNNSFVCHYNNSQIKFLAKVYDVKNETDKQKINVQATGVINGNKIYPVQGNVLITQSLYPKYNYGDILIVSCNIKTPEKFEDFNYQKYLAAKNIYSVCSFAELRKINSSNGFWPKAIILKIKEKLSNGLKNSISEPESSVLRAMILNETGDIPQHWNDTFSNLGLTHIIAISGSHITIIVSLIMFLAIAFGLARPKAFWVALFGIVVYIIMIGFPASAVRAAIMGIFVVYGQKIGRSGSAIGLILIAASIMLVINPLLLLYDVGFQLSFLAVMGLIYFSPAMENWLRKVPNFLQLREMLVATLSAQLMVLPLIIFQFGKFSPISVLANILILPVIPFLTVFALLNALVGAIFPWLGVLMGYVSWLFTLYWLEVSALVQKINYFSFGFEINWVWLVICYVAIGFFIFWINGRKIGGDL